MPPSKCCSWSSCVYHPLRSHWPLTAKPNIECSPMSAFRMLCTGRCSPTVRLGSDLRHLWTANSQPECFQRSKCIARWDFVQKCTHNETYAKYIKAKYGRLPQWTAWSRTRFGRKKIAGLFFLLMEYQRKKTKLIVDQNSMHFADVATLPLLPMIPDDSFGRVFFHFLAIRGDRQTPDKSATTTTKRQYHDWARSKTFFLLLGSPEYHWQFISVLKLSLFRFIFGLNLDNCISIRPWPWGMIPLLATYIFDFFFLFIDPPSLIATKTTKDSRRLGTRCHPILNSNCKFLHPSTLFWIIFFRFSSKKQQHACLFVTYLHIKHTIPKPLSARCYLSQTNAIKITHNSPRSAPCSLLSITQILKPKTIIDWQLWW